MPRVSVVIPNWNGAESLAACLDSLLDQSQDHDIIVVENGSVDESFELLRSKYPQVEVVALPRNRGFAGGVNAGIRRAIGKGAEYVALLNNDAVADKSWLKNLVGFLEKHPEAGIAGSKMLSSTGEYLDGTGDLYTVWGLPYPRGRREAVTDKYDRETWVFAASGGASIYRVEMLQAIGLFDEDFFAYYEDTDISFRAQLAGWKIGYEPAARVNHLIGGTSSGIKGFAAYQTAKNLPWLFWKNVPRPLLWRMLPRFYLAYSLIWLSAVVRGHGLAATKGVLISKLLLPKKIAQRLRIQRSMKVKAGYIDSIIVHDLPPNAGKLRSLRSFWWKLTGKNNG